MGRLTVIDKYRNLTATETDIRDDLENRAMTLRAEQDKEKELLDIINETIEAENQTINAKMDISDFKLMINNAGFKTVDILREVKNRADKLRSAERPPVVTPPVETPAAPPTEAPTPAPTLPPASAPSESETLYYAIYKISGSKAQLQSVSAFLKSNGISYEVKDQGILE